MGILPTSVYLSPRKDHKMSYDLISFAYAALVALGGIMGFVKKGSIMSAAMGVIAGSLAGFGAYQTSVNPNNYILSLLVSAGLTALMGYRFVNSGKFMPAGLVLALSLAMVARYGLRMAGLTRV